MLKPMLPRRTLLARPATAAGGSTVGLRGGRAATAAPQATGTPWIWRSAGENATTGQAVMEGDDPLRLRIYRPGLTKASPSPYQEPKVR
jgi:hypothetical protein